MVASPGHDDPPASTAQAARPPPVVKGRHRQRHSVALPWLAGVRHSSAVGADHKPTARSHSWDARENLCRSLWLMRIVGWESCEKISGKRLFWELPRLGGRETEKHRFAACSHLPLTACTSCFLQRKDPTFDGIWKEGRHGIRPCADRCSFHETSRSIPLLQAFKPRQESQRQKEKEETNGNRNRRTMPELLPTPRVGGSSPFLHNPNAGRTAAGTAFSSARSRRGPGAVHPRGGIRHRGKKKVEDSVRRPATIDPSSHPVLALPLLPHHYGPQLIDSPAPPNRVSAKTWSLPLAIGREGGCCKTWRRVDQSLIPPRDTGPAPQATSDVEIRAQPGLAGGSL